MMEGDGRAKEVEPRFLNAARSSAAGLYLVILLWAVIGVVFPDNALLFVLVTITAAVLATSWMTYDAKARGQSILPVLRMLCLFLWPFGLIIYLCYRSGMGGLCTAMIHAMGLYFTLLVGANLTLYILRVAGWLDIRLY